MKTTVTKISVPYTLMWVDEKFDVVVDNTTFQVTIDKEFTERSDRIEKIGDSQGEMSYSIFKVIYEDNEYIDNQREAFEIAKRVINKVLNVYRVALNEPHVGPVSTIETLQYKVMFYDEEGRKDKTKITLNDLGGLTPDRKIAMNKTVKDILSDKDGLGVEYKCFGNARYFLVNENLRSAIIEADSAFELFVQKALKYKLQKKGEKEHKISNILEGGIKNLLLHHLDPSNAFPEIEGTPPYQEWLSARDLRNAIVHEGKKPSYSEAEEAVDAYEDFAIYCGMESVEEKFGEFDYYLYNHQTEEYEPYDK